MTGTSSNPITFSLPRSISDSLPTSISTSQDSTIQNILPNYDSWNLSYDNLINFTGFNLSNMENHKLNSDEISSSFQNSSIISDISLDESNIDSNNVFSSTISTYMNIDNVPMSLSSYLTFPNQGFNLHIDSNANFLASHYGADAVTIGNDIFFRHDQFDTSTITGFGLLVHELTHISQLENQNPAKIDALTENRWEREAISNENQALVDHYEIKSRQPYEHNLSKNTNQFNNVDNLTHNADFHPTHIHRSNPVIENNTNPVLTADSEREIQTHPDESSNASMSTDEIVDLVYEKIVLKIKEQKERRGW